MTPADLHARLTALADPKYKTFGDNLQPGITDRIGVRMPVVRQISKEISKAGGRAFLDMMLAEGRFASQEALYIALIVLGQTKDLTSEERLQYADRLLPHMTGWATCDLFGSALKVFREDPGAHLAYIRSKLASDNKWTVRVAEVWMLEHYKKPEWVQPCLELLGESDSKALPLAAGGDYYLSMALAWCLSMLAVEDGESVYASMEAWRDAGRLDAATVKRTVRKIQESFQFTADEKTAVAKRFAGSK